MLVTYAAVRVSPYPSHRSGFALRPGPNPCENANGTVTTRADKQTNTINTVRITHTFPYLLKGAYASLGSEEQDTNDMIPGHHVTITGSAYAYKIFRQTVAL